MATYAIGDVQGCFDELQALLTKVQFAKRDRLWFVGDLVNRGPKSLEVLRFVRDLGERAVVVLGNHDLHLVTQHEGFAKPRKYDTFTDVLDAPDRRALVDWLRARPLMHVDADHAMVHAGLLPQWSIARALGLAGEVESALKARSYREFLANMYGNEPARWRDDLAGYDRLRVIVNAMSRLRLVTPDGTMEFNHKLGLANLPAGYVPWYDAPGRASRGERVIFGHWAALGLLLREDVICLDSGCVWGRALTALRLEDQRVFQLDCPELEGTASEP